MQKEQSSTRFTLMNVDTHSYTWANAGATIAACLGTKQTSRAACAQSMNAINVVSGSMCVTAPSGEGKARPHCMEGKLSMFLRQLTCTVLGVPLIPVKVK
jgi:hypothetical protein